MIKSLVLFTLFLFQPVDLWAEISKKTQQENSSLESKVQPAQETGESLGDQSQLKEASVDQKKTDLGSNDSEKSVFLGHLLTPTTYLPKKKTVTVGTHVIAYSFTDELMVGTSSFLLFFYNSPNVYVKYGRQFSKKQKWAVQLNYLKSDIDLDFFNTEYYMEAAMGWFSWSYDITSFYTFNASVSYMYFLNEGKPHSLRREPFNDQPFQFSLTTLHDIRVSKRFGLASELGVLGINYEIPNLHGAVSFRYIRKNYFIQIGVSFDAHVLNGGFNKRSYIINNPTLDASHTDDFVIHPEAAFHYFF